MTNEKVELIVNEISTMHVELEEHPKPGMVVVAHSSEDPQKFRIMFNPTWKQIIEAFNEVQTEIPDHHHIYLEDVQWEEIDSWWHVTPRLGS